MKTWNHRNSFFFYIGLALILTGGCKDDPEETPSTTEEETNSTPSKVEKPESEEETEKEKDKKGSDIRERRLKHAKLEDKKKTSEKDKTLKARAERPAPTVRKPQDKKNPALKPPAVTDTESKDKKAKPTDATKVEDPTQKALDRANTLASITPEKSAPPEKTRPTREKAKVVPPVVKTTETSPATAIPPRPKRPPLAIDNGLQARELTQLTGKTFQKVSLPGKEPSPNYNAIRFNQDPSHYGVSVQVWQETQLRDTRARYENMKSSYPNVSVTGNITSDTFFAHWGTDKNKLYYLVFMELKKRKIISVTADANSLEPNQLFVIATRVRDRLLSSARRR